MRVLLLGVDNGRFPSFAYQCREAVKSLGHEEKYLNSRGCMMHKTAPTNSILNKWLFQRIERYDPDLLLVNKGTNIRPGFIGKLSDKGIKTVNWTLDEPFGRINAFNRIDNIGEYDHFFVFDPYYLDELKEINPSSHYLPCAADPMNVHKEVIPLKKRGYSRDISFIGSHDVKRERILSELAGYDLMVSGYRWDKVSGGLKSRIDPRIYRGQEMCREFNRSRINVNIHAEHSVEGVNIRAFEIPAVNSFQVCDYFKEIPKLFDPGREIVCYRDVGELKELADYYLDEGNVEERDRITVAGHERVLKEHTIRHRIEKILKVVH
ncbi:MAG: glycosyltransferase [Candidatus Altiarchaeota archaeon]|nr:glycosyltransferase [Candidatus Altiarchaeota archaeon]